MTYRDDRAALSQRIADLNAQLAGIRGARESLSTLDAEEKSVIDELDALRKKTAPSASDLRKHLPMLERIEVASPCSVPWDSMQGDEQKRFCGQCKLHVYNIAAMTRADAEALFACEGSSCVRLFRRADGTVITSDCPVGLRRKRRRRLAAVVVVAATAAAAVMGALAVFQREGVVTGRTVEAKPTPHNGVPQIGQMVQPQGIPDMPIQGGISAPTAPPQEPTHVHPRMGRRAIPEHRDPVGVVGFGG